MNTWRPFVLQVLIDEKPDLVTNADTKKHILERFGLDIPIQTIELVLKRIAKQNHIKKEHGIYRIVGDLPNPDLAAKQSNAELHIRCVLRGLCEFSKDTIKPIGSNKDAVVSICAFLAEFGITCLRSHIQGTAMPALKGTHQTDIVLVSDYVQHLQKTDPTLFGSFIVLVKGNMLANALMCPDLAKVPGTYRDVTFYLDTPLLFQRLGLEDKAREDATRELISLLIKLKGKVAIFSHSRSEFIRVLDTAAKNLGRQDDRRSIALEARKRGTKKSDLLHLAASIDDKLSNANIEVIETPPYTKDSQIDERVFESVLDDDVSYQNPRAKEDDINSVRSIYVLRGNTSAIFVEKARAILVTNNASLAHAAYRYGNQHEAFKDVSSVITNFSLANMAWLKVPMEASSIPKTQLLAFSYAALEPSNKLLDKFIAEIDKLEACGGITERDHQMLRSYPHVYPELMHLTLGEDAALTEQTITKVCEHVSNEIRKEEHEKFSKEQEAHQETQNALDAERIRRQEVIQNLNRQCKRWAKIMALIPTTVIGIVVSFGIVFGLYAENQFITWTFFGVCILLTTLMTLSSLFYGTNLQSLHKKIYRLCLAWLLKLCAKVTSVSIDELRVD